MKEEGHQVDIMLAPTRARIIYSCREPDMATNYVREEIKEINDQTR